MRAVVRVCLKCLGVFGLLMSLSSCTEHRIDGNWTITAIVDLASSAPANTSGTPPLPVDSRIEVRCFIHSNYLVKTDMQVTDLQMTVAKIACTNLRSISRSYPSNGDLVELWFSGATSYTTRLTIDGVFAHNRFAPGRFTAKIYDLATGVLIGESQGIFAMNKR